MSRPNSVADLLRRLETADSPVSQLGLLARGWRIVRSLGPEERSRLAQNLHLEGADRLVELLGARDGSAAEAVLKAVRQAESLGIEHLGQVLDGLRDPERRAEAATAARARLTPAGDASPADLSEEPADPSASPGGRENSLASGSDRPASPPPALAAPPSKPIDSPGEVHAARPAVWNVSPSRLLPHPGDMPPVADTDSGSDPAARIDPVVGDHRPSSPGARLGWLRRQLPALADAGPGVLTALVEEFPPGWPRRRAVRTLFQAGVPAELDAVLALAAATLATPWDAAWCLAAVMTGRPLTGAERERVVAAASTAATRRRLRVLSSLQPPCCPDGGAEPSCTRH